MEIIIAVVFVIILSCLLYGPKILRARYKLRRLERQNSFLHEATETASINYRLRDYLTDNLTLHECDGVSNNSLRVVKALDALRWSYTNLDFKENKRVKKQLLVILNDLLVDLYDEGETDHVREVEVLKGVLFSKMN